MGLTPGQLCGFHKRTASEMYFIVSFFYYYSFKPAYILERSPLFTINSSGPYEKWITRHGRDVKCHASLSQYQLDCPHGHSEFLNCQNIYIYIFFLVCFGLLTSMNFFFLLYKFNVNESETVLEYVSRSHPLHSSAAKFKIIQITNPVLMSFLS